MKKKYFPTFSLVLPFYNEEKNLKILIPQILNILKKIKNSYKIILIDDVSNDNSLKICRGFKKKNRKIKVYKLFKKGRQTGAIKKAINKINSDYVICMDTDLQDNPKYLPEFVKNINKGYDLVIGKRVRVASKAPLILTFAVEIYDLIMELYFKKKLKTYRSPYIATRLKFLKKLPWFKNDHRYLVPISLSRGAKKCMTVDYVLQGRRHGVSNYNARLKVISGFFEVMIFLFRLIFKSYK